jgi:hypothetical protein
MLAVPSQALGPEEKPGATEHWTPSFIPVTTVVLGLGVTMGTLQDYLRRVVPALAGFLIGAAIYGLFTGSWQWDYVAGGSTGVAVMLLITVLRSGRERT